ncbi:MULTISPECIES: hypothetical protein [Clostridium]|uniref:Uncharacterized protein n=1 Tax=Clostridium cibarium TaxID=2762247 RepID=A0ABR8PXB7_9CLOT|nr:MULTISPECIES: hypothetical protein [Clostridium]MBD7912787.1 hypothetical protein [Clostridium cibarium]
MDIFDQMILYFKFFCAIFIITTILNKLLFKDLNANDGYYYTSKEIQESNERLRKSILIIKGISCFFTVSIGIIGLFIVVASLGFAGAGGNSGGGSSYSSEDNNIHHVRPNDVQDYYRQDGTHVDGYHRGGDEGYYRSNPDGRTDNNLNSR